MDLIASLRAWRRKKQRRRIVNDLKACFDVVDIEWRPSARSPLRLGDATVRLPLDGIIGPRTLAYEHWHDEHTQLLRSKLDKRPDRRYFMSTSAPTSGW